MRRDRDAVKLALLITRSDTVGGAHVHVMDLALAARDHGHVVSVLVGGDGPYAELLRAKGLSVVSLRHLVRPIRPVSDLLAVRELAHVIRRLAPDVLHTHSFKAGIVGRLVAKILGVPVVFTAHGWAFTEGIAARSRSFGVVVERLASRVSDAIICVSDYDLRLARGVGVGNGTLLTRIHNGVREVPADLMAAGKSSGPVRIVCVARLDAPKNHALLVDALADLPELGWEIEFIGDGPLTESVRSRVKRYGLEDRVAFSGLCDDVAERLSRAQLFVLVSEWEGLPLSILEAMRAGLPVIASDVGGVSESVVDGVTGYVIPRGDKKTLVDCLRRLIEDESLRRGCGERGREVYEREFTFELMWQRTLAVYEKVLSSNKGSG